MSTLQSEWWARISALILLSLYGILNVLLFQMSKSDLPQFNQEMKLYGQVVQEEQWNYWSEGGGSVVQETRVRLYSLILKCRIEVHVSHLGFMSYSFHMLHVYICMHIYACINISINYTSLYCIFHCVAAEREEIEKD